MSPPAEGTRRYARRPISRLVAFQTQAFEGVVDPRSWIARTADLSEGGLRLETNRQLAEGDRLVLEIAVGDEVVRASAVVVHVQPRREVYSAGAEFESVDPVTARKLLQS